MRHPGRRTRGRGHRRALTAVLASALLLTGCAQSVDPIERLGKKAAEGVRTSRPRPDDAYRRWGLATPLAAPPARPVRLLATHTGPASDPRVLDHVTTTDKVVFLTYDDGSAHDPRFADMVRDLHLPVTLFLPESAVAPAAGHYARLRAAGATAENRTADRPALRGRPYTGQRAEICAEQDRLALRFGTRPHLLRPPHGHYDRTTLRAAGACGISTVVLWRAVMTTDGLTYPHGDQDLQPGDIVLVGPEKTTGHTLTDRTLRLLHGIQERGMTVARLEDYL
ncbi:polysaccharide deacetylase family protein [Streptomyces sp. NPDC048297]|uniref:polysaccharide deacetylase family protein n=1 Tax=Streptomyces sp. NPDC048297 TaxID=3365531 RepID=UPI00371E32F7